jgi:hypothetical protein
MDVQRPITRLLQQEILDVKQLLSTSQGEEEERIEVFL